MLRSTGTDTRPSFPALDGTSQPVDLLLSISRGGPHTLGAQIEEQLRARDPRGHTAPRRARAVHARPRPPARRLATAHRRGLHAARGRGLPWPGPGCTPARLGHRGRRAGRPGGDATGAAATLRLPPQRPGRQHLPAQRLAARVPRGAGLARATPISATATPVGACPAHARSPTISGSVRGVVAEPTRVVVTNGFHTGARARLSNARHRRRRAGSRSRTRATRSRSRSWREGGPRTAPGARRSTTGSRVDLPPRPVDAVLVTPAHQHPTGAVLAPRAPHRAAGLPTQARHIRHRGRLRRRVPLRPRRGRRAPGPRARPRVLRRLGQQDAGTGAPPRLARPAAPPRRGRRAREAARRPRHRAHRAARLRGLPGARRARPPPPPHAPALPRPARRAHRGARHRPPARCDTCTASPPDCT